VLNICRSPQINSIVIELSLILYNSFVASSSDFWDHPNWKKSFGAVMANFIANCYAFKNGQLLAISDTTLKKMKKSGDANKLLMSTEPKEQRVQALLNFEHFDKPKTGENIGAWLEESHENVGCKAEYIGSHVVDGASNAGKSVEVLEWNTKGERSQKIVAGPCDSHNINTTAKQASGLSDHVINLNPDLGKSLKLLRLDMTKLCMYKSCKDILGHCRQEHGREKYTSILYSVLTRWLSTFLETESVNINQFDIEAALKRIKAPVGVDKDLRTDGVVEEVVGMLEPRDFNMFYQYEGGMMPLRRYCESSQSTQAIGHEELFMGRECIEQLRSSFFVMYENISRKMGDKGGKDLTVSVMPFHLIFECLSHLFLLLF